MRDLLGQVAARTAILSLILALAMAAGCAHRSEMREIEQTAMASVRIVAHVPSEVEDVYLAGNLPELGPWEADGLLMQANGDLREAVMEVPRDFQFEFKLTRGTWQSEALAEDGSVPGNHVVTVSGDTTVEFTVARFAMSYEEEFADEMTPVDIEGMPLALMAPLDWQVIQRSALSGGVVPVSGRVIFACDAVELQVVDSETGEAIAEPLTLRLDSATGAFEANVPLPAGGWYRLTASAVDSDSGETQMARVEHFGIGEVFVGAGQSNSTNCGQFRIQQTSGMVSSFSGTYWRLADDPQPGAADRSTGGSFWPAFGDEMHARLGVPIGVAVTGYGGTSVVAWEPGQGLYEFMLERVQALGPDGFRAILWHQGEADAEMPSDEYFTRMQALIRQSQFDAEWEIPWVTAQASYHNVQNPAWENVRSAQQRLWDEGVSLEGPDTDSLTGGMRDYDGTGTHFSPEGLRAHGQMWAEKVSVWMDQLPSAD